MDHRRRNIFAHVASCLQELQQKVQQLQQQQEQLVWALSISDLLPIHCCRAFHLVIVQRIMLFTLARLKFNQTKSVRVTVLVTWFIDDQADILSCSQQCIWVQKFVYKLASNDGLGRVLHGSLSSEMIGLEQHCNYQEQEE